MNRCLAILALLMAITLAWTPGVAAKPQGKRATVQDVLTSRHENDKAQALVHMRQTITAADALAIVRGDSIDTIAAMAAGMYLEAAEFQAKEAADILLALNQRYGLPGMAAVQGATCGQVAALIDVLMGMPNRGRNANPQLLAADVLATYATLLSQKAPEAVATLGKKARVAHGKKANYVHPEADAIRPALEKLLKLREPEVVESALLACARLRLRDLQPTIEGRADLRTPGAIAARLLYLASIGASVPEEALEQAFTVAEAKTARRGSEPHLERLGSYLIRTAAGCYACEAIGEIRNARHLEPLHQALEHRDLRVQIDALRAIERIGAEASLPILLAKLEGTKLPWPVAVHALSAVGAIPAKSSIPPLIARLSRETGRLRLDVNYALASIIGKQHAETAEDWQSWWQENQEKFSVDRQRTAKFRQEKTVPDMHVPWLGTFYGLEIYSDRLVFVLDTSNSMQGKKIESLKFNLTNTLEGLARWAEYNVVNFGGVVSLMKPAALIAKAETPQVVQQVKTLSLSGGTRAFDALEVATTLPGVDTLILLSDGAPVAGKFSAWQRFTAAVGIYHRHWPVAIWCLGFSASEKNTAAMGRLATRNYGRVKDSEM